MMTTSDPEPSDDILARALDGLRQTPIPERPSEKAVARIVAALHAASGPRPPVPRWQRPARWAVVRSAAAVILAVGTCYIVAAWLSQPVMAFALVAQKLRDARTLAYRTTTQIAGQPPFTMRVMVKAPALLRSEGVPDGPITLFDAIRNRTLVLDSKSKSALLLEGPASADGDSPDMVAKEVGGLRKLAESRSEPVGRRRIGGALAEGFRVWQRGQELIVWVDPGAKVPLRIDLKARVNEIEVTGSLSDFQIDPRLDDALFRFEPPAGYALTTGQNAGMSDVEAIADVLRTYADHAEGAFPTRLDDWADYAKRLRQDEQKVATNPRAMRLVQSVARFQVFLIDRKGEYGYSPEGVKLGDAEKILLWFRRKGSPGYRAVYGDLHAADVTADLLPKQAAPRPGGD